MSLKKLFIIALAVGGLSAALQVDAHARPHGHGHKVMKMMFQDVDLTADQKQALKDLRPSKEERQARKKEFKDGKKRIDWMQDFADGRVSRSEVIRNIKDKMSAKHEHRTDKLEGMLDVLSTFSQEQREQVLDNLEELSDKHEAKRAKWEQKREKKGKRTFKKMERMFDGISLTSSQQRRLDAVQDFHKERREDRMEHRGQKREIMESFLTGEKSKREILRSLNEKKERHLSNKIEGAELWMELLESLSGDQQDQLFDNMQDLKEKHKERRKERKQKRNHRE